MKLKCAVMFYKNVIPILRREIKHKITMKSYWRGRLFLVSNKLAKTLKQNKKPQINKVKPNQEMHAIDFV